MRALLFLVTMLLLQGCQYDPYAHLYSTNKPKAEDLPGTYTLLRQTVDETNSVLQEKLCLIELRPDGTFIASNVPPESIKLPTTNFFDTLITSTGTWRTDTYGSVDNNNDQPKTVWGVYLDSYSSNILIQPLHLAGSQPPYGLICTLGDPDTGQAMLFIKQSPPGATNELEMDPFTLDKISDGVPGISLLFVIVILFIVILFFALALVAGVILAVLAAILISLGVLSSSVLIGFLQRSPASGFRALFLQFGTVTGTACGVGATWLVSVVANAYWHPISIILLGGSVGLGFGLLIAFLFNLAWSRVVDWLLRRFRNSN